MNTNEHDLAMLTIGRNALITAIMALNYRYAVHELEDLRDSVNRKIKEIKESMKDDGKI